MRFFRVGWVAWSMWALSVALIAGSMLLDSLTPPRWLGEDEYTLLDALIVVLSLVYVTVGVLVASRRPENPIGWIFCGTGLIAISFQGFALTYAAYALGVGSGSLPGGEYMAWVSEWVAMPVVALGTVLLWLLFPGGRLPSRRWRIVVWIAVLGSIMLAVGEALAPGLLDVLSIENPLEIGGVVGRFVETLGKFGIFLFLASMLLAALSLIMRLVRARGEERQQLKWFAFAAAMMIGGFSTFYLLSFSARLNEIGWFMGFLGFMLFPVAVGIAILRHHLYDIDIIINRALIYGPLTVTLALVYFGGVASTQLAFRTLTGLQQQPQLAIVASTLAIAALFNPLRRRIQSFIDRLFYREKYDTRRVLEAFSSRLRDETDLDSLNAEITSVVRDTLRPAHVSLWLLPREDRVER